MSITFANNNPHTPIYLQSENYYMYNFDISFNITYKAYDLLFSVYGVRNDGSVIRNPGGTAYAIAGAPYLVSSGDTTNTSSINVFTNADGGQYADATLNIWYIYGVFSTVPSETIVVTVITTANGPQFQLNGINKPLNILFMGAVYTFDQSDSTNNGYQIGFKDNNNNPYNTGVVSTGIPGTNGQTVFTVASNSQVVTLRDYSVVQNVFMGNIFSLNINPLEIITPYLSLTSRSPPTVFDDSTVAISAYNISGDDNNNFTFDISYSLTPAIPQGSSFQLYSSTNTTIGAVQTVLANTTKNSARISYSAISIPSSTIYGRFSHSSGFVNTASIKILAPYTYPTNTPVPFDVFVVPPLQIAGDNKQTVINRTSLLQSILQSVQGNNFASIKAYISTNLFPFTSDELTKLSFKGITKIRTIVAPSNNGGATSAIPVAPGNGTATFNVSTLSPNEGLYIEFFNCGDSITLTNGSGFIVIKLLGTAGTLPLLYGQNTYSITNLPNVSDGAMIPIFGYNIVLGGALGTPVQLAETICFHRGTHILTPEGYKSVELFQAGDLITTTKNIKASIPIKDMVKFIGRKEDGALYCLPKDSLKKGKPLNDLYMSGDHAYKHNGIWKHMKCASPDGFPHSRTKKYTHETDEEDIEYYHIVIDDYFAHTIVAEGVEVETCFKDKEDGIMMVWSCDEKACTPLKCEKKKEKVEEKKAIVNKKSMFSPYIQEEEPKPIVKPLLNIVKGAAANEQKNKKKNMTIWAYNKELNKNMPLDCNEITLPM